MSINRPSFRLGFSRMNGHAGSAGGFILHANDQSMDGEGRGVRNLSFLLVFVSSVFAGVSGSAALISLL